MLFLVLLSAGESVASKHNNIQFGKLFVGLWFFFSVFHYSLYQRCCPFSEALDNTTGVGRYKILGRPAEGKKQNAPLHFFLNYFLPKRLTTDNRRFSTAYSLLG